MYMWWVDLSQQPNTLQNSHSLPLLMGWRENRRQEGSGFKAMTVCNTGFFEHTVWRSLHESLISKPIFFLFQILGNPLIIDRNDSN